MSSLLERIEEIHINVHGQVVVRYTGGRCEDVTDKRGTVIYRPEPKAALSQQEAEPVVAGENDCVTVQSGSINWLKEKFPDLCIKAGLCERIGGRLYTKTVRPTPKPAALPQPHSVKCISAGVWESTYQCECGKCFTVNTEDSMGDAQCPNSQPVASVPQDSEDSFERWVNTHPGYTYRDVWQAGREYQSWLSVASVPQGLEEFGKLLRFAQEIMQYFPHGDVDGADLQNHAIDCGLLSPVTKTEPCGESCNCAEYYSTDEFSEGITCHRKSAMLTASKAGI